MKASELTHHMMALKLSQADLARLLPMSVSAVARMCRGVTPVSPIVDRLLKLWIVYPVSYQMHRNFVKNEE